LEARPAHQEPPPGGAGGAGGDRRLASFDGIRALAVAAVLAYHFGVPGVGGGLLGVDAFFVLSGFLITSLLCDEHRRASTIALVAFWGRRARRLLPALFLLLAGVALYAWWSRQSVDLPSLRADALATLGFVANWRFVFSHQGYFNQAMAPSPLLNMWSLGVEEQFYLVWPLVVLAVVSRWGTRRLVWVAAVGTGLSAVLTACLFRAGFSTDRLYYGTDTRAQALLLGAALGAVATQRSWHVFSRRWASTRGATTAGTLLGLVGLASLVWCWHAVQGQGAFLYEGGFLVVAASTGAVIASVTTWRTSVLARALALRPVAYVGLISYGLYLYHWPLSLAIDHAHTSLSGFWLFAARTAATFAVSIASYHLVERPLRRAAVTRRWRGFSLAAGGAAAVVAVLLLATLPAPTAPGVVVAPNGLSAAERAELAAAGAFGPHPVRFLMLGDSVALTATVGLEQDSVRRYGVKIWNGGILGCNLSPGAERLGGVVYGVPGGAGGPCARWPAIYRRALRQYRPDVVGILIGRFELADTLVDGRWVHVGEAGWDRTLTGELDRAVEICSSLGARVVLFTFPYLDPPLEQPDGTPWPENAPSRVDAWNRIVRHVAAEHPKAVTLVRLNALLDPGGRFTYFLGGVRVRWKDTGIHITRAGGELLQPKILPLVDELGLAARRHAPVTAP
jgi:peptidoglycan/LPS O-acetylase OafA/YrhL